MDPASFRGLVGRIGTPSLCLTSEDESQMYLAAHVLTSQLRRKAKDLLARSKHEPVLWTYMSDGWGSTITSRYSAKIGDTFYRNARFRHEFLLQLGLIKVAKVDGSFETCIVLDGAVSLRNGKRAWQCFQAGCDFWPLLRFSGHLGIVCNFYVFDGLLCKPLTRHFQSRHDLLYSEYGLLQHPQPELARLTDWCFSLKCAAHVCSNAVKTGLRELVSENVLDNAHILIESLRNGSDALHAHVPDFLVKCMEYTDVRSASPEELWTFWCSVGVPRNLLDEFVAIDPVFRDGKLFVASFLSVSEDGWQRVAAILTFGLRWEKFSETRWVGVGRASRLYLLSLLLGVEGILSVCRGDEHCSFFNLGGYSSRANFQSKLYLATAALCTYPCEAMAAELFEDDRAIRRAEELKGSLQEELEYLQSLPDSSWLRFAAAVGGPCCGPSLRVQVMRSALSSMGYVYRELFAQFDLYPLRLAVGNLEERLDELALASEVHDPTASKVKALLSLEFPRQQIIWGLRLAQEAPCTTTLVEQCHGSGAIIMKAHRAYGEKSLRARQVVHQCKRLVQQASASAALSRMEAELASLEGAAAPTISARHAYFKFAHRTMVLPEDPKSRVQLSKRLMRQHAAEFASLRPIQRAAFEQIAERMRAEKIAASQERCEELRSRISLFQSRREQELLTLGLPNHLDSCRFTAQDLEQMATAFDAASKVPGLVGRLAMSMQESPSAPSLAEQQVLIGLEVAAQQRPPCPWWIKRVSAQRERFSGCAFAGSPNSAEVFLLLYALKSPIGAQFMRLRRSPPTSPALEAVVSGEAIHPARARFEFDRFECVDELGINIDEGGDIWVLANMCMGGDGVFCDSEPELFESFSLLHPDAKSRSKASSSSGGSRLHLPKDVRESLLQEYPWLTEEDLPELVKKKLGGRSRSGGDRRDRPTPVREEEEVLQVVQVPDQPAISDGEALEQLAAFRNDHEPARYDEVFFYTRILGGAWTARNRGVVADGIGGYVRNGIAREWCALYSWPRQHANYYARYGIEGSTRLAREFARRSQHFVLLWVNSEDENFEYGPEHVEAYQEDFIFVNWLCEQPTDGWAFARGSDLRKLVPTNPVR